VAALPSLPRAWWSTDLPGYREHSRPFATYSPFPYSDLPKIEPPLDPGLEWLLAQPKVQGSLGNVDPGDPVPERSATGSQLAALVGGTTVELPPAFRTFVSEPGPRLRVRSATACYLDLGEFRVEVAGGGSLIHFLSDQQWLLHWLLFVGADGSEAVIVTERPLGFEADDRRFARFDPASDDASVCAETFSTTLAHDQGDQGYAGAALRLYAPGNISGGTAAPLDASGFSKLRIHLASTTDGTLTIKLQPSPVAPDGCAPAMQAVVSATLSEFVIDLNDAAFALPGYCTPSSATLHQRLAGLYAIDVINDAKSAGSHDVVVGSVSLIP